MSDIKDLENALDLASPRVQRNVKIVSAEDVGQDFMLHISKDTNVRKFVPMISHAQAGQEDRTMARVTVAPTLLGCIIGYARTEFDFTSFASDSKEYKGGYKIYEIPFKAALKPNATMVYDSRNSDEHWLVTYNKETQEYLPQAAGKMFIHSITYKARTGNVTEGSMQVYVEVAREEGLRFSKNIFLAKGFWRIEGPIDRNTYSWIADSEFRAVSLQKAEYQMAKLQSAALLSHTERVPTYLGW